MTGKRTAAGGLRAVFVAMAALLAVVGIGAPALAHVGPRAVVLVRNLTLAPAADGWEAHLSLADLDSGSPIIAADAKLTAGVAAPVALRPSGDNDGRYSAKLPALKPGVLDLRLVIRTAPGGAPVALSAAVATTAHEVIRAKEGGWVAKQECSVYAQGAGHAGA